AAHRVIDDIILNNAQSIPINFSVTCGPSFRQFRGESIDSRLRLSALMFRLQPQGAAMTVAVDESETFFMDPEKFRTAELSDSTVYKNETTLRVTRNLANSVLMVADTIRRAGDYERSAKLARVAHERVPHNRDGIEFLAELLSTSGKHQELEELIGEARPEEIERLRIFQARGLRKSKENDQATRILQELLIENPQCEACFEELLRLHVENKQHDQLLELVKQFVSYNPTHQRARGMLPQLERMAAERADSISKPTDDSL
ncbi:MAG: hypothetical protein V3T31_06945, partial [candidate division Zixibacteria bacterium]